MYHIVYLTRNLLNDKFYIGVHSTADLNDGYLGSGTILRKAIKKYGETAFKCEVLHFCSTKLAALKLEQEIVNEEFIQRTDTYNIKCGGTGGDTWSFNPRLNELKELKRQQSSGKNNGMYGKDRSNYYLLVSPEGIQLSCKGLTVARQIIGTSMNRIVSLSKFEKDHYNGWQCFLYNSEFKIKPFNVLSKANFKKVNQFG